MLMGSFTVVGFATGSFAASFVSAEYKRLAYLSDALNALEIQICTYNEGLSKALKSSGANKYCTLFYDIAQNLNNNTQSIPETVALSAYTSDIKQALIMLFDTILSADEDQIRKSFSATINIVGVAMEKAKLNKEKNSPLYRKIGLLAGLAAAILLM